MIDLKDVEKLLCTGDVAKLYNLTSKAALKACREGKFSEQEAVKTTLGWLITPAAAQRVWGKKLRKEE